MQMSMTHEQFKQHHGEEETTRRYLRDELPRFVAREGWPIARSSLDWLEAVREQYEAGLRELKLAVDAIPGAIRQCREIWNSRPDVIAEYHLACAQALKDGTPFPKEPVDDATERSQEPWRAAWSRVDRAIATLSGALGRLEREVRSREDALQRGYVMHVRVNRAGATEDQLAVAEVVRLVNEGWTHSAPLALHEFVRVTRDAPQTTRWMRDQIAGEVERLSQPIYATGQPAPKAMIG
jgi:hypothetical protein